MPTFSPYETPTGAGCYQQNKLSEFSHFAHKMPIIPPEYLTVTVIPLEAHLNPYEMVVEVNSDNDKNLK